MTDPTTPGPDDDADAARRQQEWDALPEQERDARIRHALSQMPVNEAWKEWMTNMAIEQLIDVYIDLEQRVTELERRNDPSTGT